MRACAQTDYTRPSIERQEELGSDGSGDGGAGAGVGVVDEHRGIRADLAIRAGCDYRLRHDAHRDRVRGLAPGSARLG